MSLTLQPMTDEYFATWNERLVVEYAREKVEAGVWTEEHALQLSRKEQAETLPDGRRTTGHELFVGVVDDDVVGNLWLFTDPELPVPSTYIYDIEILESHRGKGLGRALLGAAEAWSAEHGSASVRLNVFAPNTTARALYESAGYQLTSMHMMKRIPSA
ncbi:GNAT family N-acetyltransferase [Aeromicrobium sp. NPDC092404]|uniref:GNAT family N-acetyltransferase n=1 Tax=Aeromicrobium sp. NPDC092404 TaxID=3154976 RepID=UPI0034182E50